MTSKLTFIALSEVNKIMHFFLVNYNLVKTKHTQG